MNQWRCAYCGKFIDRNRPPEPVCDDYDCQKQHTEEMDASIRRHNAKLAKRREGGQR